MRLIDILNEATFSEYMMNEMFTIEILDKSIVESFNESLMEAANISTISATSKKDTRYIGVDMDKKVLITKVAELIKTTTAEAWKNPKATRKAFLRIRFVTEGGKTGLADFKKIGIKAGGKPKEVKIYTPCKTDIKAKEDNIAKGVSRDVYLKNNQFSVIVGELEDGSAKRATINLNYMIGVIMDNKLYNVKGSGSKIIEYAKAVAPAMVDARTRLAKITTEFGLKQPTIRSEEEVEKYVIDSIVKDNSNAAKIANAAALAAKARKDDGIKDDYSIEVYSYRNKKITIKAQVNLEPLVKKGTQYGSIVGSKIPDSWTGSKTDWAKMAKSEASDLITKISDLVGHDVTFQLSFGSQWATLYFTYA